MNDRLVRELVYATGNIDRSKLSIDAKTGDFDNKSTDAHYTNSSFDVVKNYEEIALGKKTIIFNSSSKVNAIVLQAFLDKGYENVKLFDSVNETENRKKVLEWFKNTPDAILLNVNCFTTGFDEPTLECVMINRATLSLSLFHQMVGRGGRKCDEIYKPNFIHIDLGGNIEAHGRWSDEVDWKSIFYGSNEKPRAKKEALDQTKQCPECGTIHAKNELCECCYIEEETRKTVMSSEVAQLIDEIPKPNGRKIVAYVEKIGRDKNFAWVILQNQILDLFIRHEVTFGTYVKAEKNGKFEISMRNIIKEPYASIQGSNLQGTSLRTKAYIINKVKTKLNDYYSRKQNTATGVHMVQQHILHH
ncbi:MAG: helicase-related protein [Bacteroidota bacterium]